MEKKLSNLDWTLEGFHKYVPMHGVIMETGVSHNNLTGIIPATVPGGVHYDLYRAGQLAHPYKDMNSLTAEWVENRWWVYRTTFTPPPYEANWHKTELIFKGLDYEAIILINNKNAATHKGMFTPLTVDITEECRKGGPISLTIVFKGIPDEIGQTGYTSLTKTQKARFTYKWDFATRLVNIGVWRDIVFKAHEALSFSDIYLTTDYDEPSGIINVSGKIIAHEDGHEPKVRISATLSGDTVLDETFTASKEFFRRFTLEAPSLWYPNGSGRQPIYDINLELLCGGHVVDTKTYKAGIRRLRYLQNDDAPQGALPYTIEINNRKIYIKGINMVPLDHIYGNIAYEHYNQMLQTAKNMHINMIRIWGGGIFEHDVFYDLCDKYGIMVWQDFIQSSSGIDNIPAKDPAFLEELAENVTAGIKEKRNHTSLTLWCGGNELMDANSVPSDYTDMNIAMLRGLAEKYDPTRFFLPTSASGPNQNLSKVKGKSHDIHGWWEYLGNPAHYERYYDSDSLLHSEFGTEGLGNVKTISKYISEEYLTPRDVNDHIIWKHRGQWWGTYKRDLKEFKEITDMEHFQNMSQWLQAEGLRFILEQNRSRKFRNSGSLIWQLNEPWPNITGTYLVDYNLEQKMAYYYAKKVYEPIHAALRYRKLNYAIGENFDGELFVDSSIGAQTVKVAVIVRDVTGKVLWERPPEAVSLATDVAYRLPNVQFAVTEDFGELFLVTLMTTTDTLEVIKNTYVFSTDDKFPYASSAKLRNASLVAEEVRRGINPDGSIVVQYKVENVGRYAALHIRAEETTDCFWSYADKLFEILMPGESEVFSFTCTRKVPSGFLIDSYDENAQPQFVFSSF